MVIKINVTNKRAALVGSPVIVCGNSGYTLEFTFDAEWSAESVRTARFVYVRDGSVQYQDVVFSGPTAQVPVLANVQEVRVGVFAGELHTSTPALIPCERSIRCGTGAPEDPTPSQYDQIMALISGLPSDPVLIDRVADAVKTEVPLVKAAEQPEIVDSIEECTDTEKAYVLPDGYIYTYGVRHIKTYTNLLPTLTDVDGSIYGGTGYKDNVHINYNNGIDYPSPYTQYFATGFIPVIPVNGRYTIRMRGTGIAKNSNNLIYYYDSSKVFLSCKQASAVGEFYIDENGDAVLDASTASDLLYIRFAINVGFSTTPDFASMIITVNEEIFEGDVEGFYSTGLAYQAMDYEPRIVELEKDVAELEEDIAELKESGGGNVTFDYAAYGLPELALTGDVSAMTKANAVTLDYVYGDKSGTCTVKWQGSSSLTYPKKNYTVKFDNAFEAVDGWGEQKKYCFKANYIDHTHARNIVSARLWAAIVRSRTPANETLKALHNCGAIDGFPCVITINGKYQGVYTFNIPKDGWMFGMGNGTSEAIICAENDSAATRLKEAAVIGTDFSLEYVTDENNAGWVTTSVNRMIAAIGTVLENNGVDMDATLAPYLDLESAIDYYIFVTLLGGLDLTNKNYLLVTYDGTKWFFSAYDMDSTYGLYWNGKSFNSPASYGASYYSEINRLMNLIRTYKKDALKARYKQLRNGALSDATVSHYFTSFVARIPERLYISDTEVWAGIPSSAASNLAQIVNWYQMRGKIIDAQMEAL